jgi:branched-chain amino acid transport system permease protein
MQALNGVSIAMFLALVSVGLSLVFGTARVVNLAHGAFYMLGAYMMVAIYEKGPEDLWWFWCSIVFAGIGVGIISGIIEVILLRQIYKRGQHLQLILTFGLTLIIGTGIMLVWGSDYKKMNRPEALAGMVPYIDIPFPLYSLVIVCLVPAVMVVLGAILKFTRWGMFVRAASVDRPMLESVGVNTNRLFSQVFIFSSFLGGIAGALAAPMVSVDLAMGTEILLNAFVVVIVGGLGSVAGGLIGALIVGELQSFGVLILPEISSVIIYVVMLLVLIFRPWGLMGKAEGRVEDEGVGV